jgi:hypothetical protein
MLDDDVSVPLLLSPDEPSQNLPGCQKPLPVRMEIRKARYHDLMTQSIDSFGTFSLLVSTPRKAKLAYKGFPHPSTHSRLPDRDIVKARKLNRGAMNIGALSKPRSKAAAYLGKSVNWRGNREGTWQQKTAQTTIKEGPGK